MNAPALELHFGPASELISVGDFLDKVLEFDPIVPDEKPDTEDYSVDDIRDRISETWDNPRLSGYLNATSNQTLASLQAKPSKAKAKRKRHLDDTEEHPDITELRDSLDSIEIESWRLHEDTPLFLRGPKNTDYNTLAKVRTSDPGAAISSSMDAILFATVYDKIVWGAISRGSQHACLASQTLDDLMNAIPCMRERIPVEVRDDEDRVVRYKTAEEAKTEIQPRGCVICIEGVAYGDGQSSEDYATKLTEALSKSMKSAKIAKSKSDMRNTKLSSLSLKLHEPYWLLHKGSCEHFVVFTEIRMVHSSDLTSGYPLTTHVTPSILGICRICTKVPAVWSVIGDVRLGENPCLVCGPCWRSLGPAENVLAVPLEQYRV
ncbi:snRNA-activating protein of 50kDa MW C terminal-domain-containing protein [Mycena floridula]|nr:snRNA-activating protein of 50kDa MW C terminal-domain-containing protein [Mycena floridula]